MTAHKAKTLLFQREGEQLTRLLRSTEDGAALMEEVYRLGLDAHRRGDLQTAKTAYLCLCEVNERNPEIGAWARFKLAELLQCAGDAAGARPHLQRALELKPGLDKAKVHLADPDEPLGVCFGQSPKAPEEFISVAADPGDDFAWEYLFEHRKPDAVFFDSKTLARGAPDCLSNALRHMPEGGAIWSESPHGRLQAKVGDIRALTRAYAHEFSRWRETLTCAWLMAKVAGMPGERDIEWPWVLGRAARRPTRGRLLDVGSFHTPLPGEFAKLGYAVTALDLSPEDSTDPDGITVARGDIRGTDLPGQSFDAISCVSTLEHIGLPGRYGIEEADPDGDALALAEMVRLLAPGGVLWLTVPFGSKDVPPVNRCYDIGRLAPMLAGFTVQESAFFIPGPDGVWRACDVTAASASDWYGERWYALGLFELCRG